ncbi:MAG: hypothetical protein U0989_07410 [Azonexus sp.]|nr:hypothetical protein [Azonexus sp.]MDZ4314577.1 hypothetical protein [Azonexus sp.]
MTRIAVEARIIAALDFEPRECTLMAHSWPVFGSESAPDMATSVAMSGKG